MIEIAGLRVSSVGDPHTAKTIVVFLHGFQMRPADLEPFADSMGLPSWFLFPEGPLAAEPHGRSWWQMDAKERLREIARGARDFADKHPPDLPIARSRLTALLDELDKLSDNLPVVLGGFSQGGMLCCDMFMRTRRRVSGLVLLSASRIAFDEWPTVDLDGLPVLISHGRSDHDLAFAAGEALRDHLAASGADVTWVPFDEGHEIPLVVWRAIRKFLRRIENG